MITSISGSEVLAGVLMRIADVYVYLYKMYITESNDMCMTVDDGWATFTQFSTSPTHLPKVKTRPVTVDAPPLIVGSTDGDSNLHVVKKGLLRHGFDAPTFTSAHDGHTVERIRAARWRQPPLLIQPAFVSLAFAYTKK